MKDTDKQIAELRRLVVALGDRQQELEEEIAEYMWRIEACRITLEALGATHPAPQKVEFAVAKRMAELLGAIPDPDRRLQADENLIAILQPILRALEQQRRTPG
ncbi:hypothetical protein [Burkholderia stagnalis]|uniref:hypothetical protein n=1 Tax=Burkholderia stagnalis TaxID=1503054 RepID=UPI00325B5F2F